jgi:hypothetical protein
VRISRKCLGDRFDLKKRRFFSASSLLGIAGPSVNNGIAKFNSLLSCFASHFRHLESQNHRISSHVPSYTKKCFIAALGSQRFQYRPPHPNSGDGSDPHCQHHSDRLFAFALTHPCGLTAVHHLVALLIYSVVVIDGLPTSQSTETRVRDCKYDFKYKLTKRFKSDNIWLLISNHISFLP